MKRYIVWLSVVLVVASAMCLSVAGRATDSIAAKKAARWEKRQIEQRQINGQFRRRMIDPRAGITSESNWQASGIRDAVRVAEYQSLRMPLSSGFSGPQPSPGISIGSTLWDEQYFHSGGYQVARTAGADCVHFCWMAQDRITLDINDYNRYVDIRDYVISTGTIRSGYAAGYPYPSRPGYPNIDVDDQNLIHVALHQRQEPIYEYHAWRIHMPIACNLLHVDDELTGTDASSCFQVLWPRIAASRGGDSAVIHEIAIEDINDCPRGLLYYWRNTGDDWTGPVVIDSSEFVSYVIADDANSNKVAVVLNPKDGNQLINVAYHQSTTSGFGWINGAELGPSSRLYITNYVDPYGPQALPDLSTTYDNSGTLHLLCSEQKVADQSERRKILHWNSVRHTLRPVALTEYDQFPSPLPTILAHATIGIGDGSTMCSNGAGMEANNNYVYVCYTKYGGETPAEQTDFSASGIPNGELYLALSNSGGNTWSPPTNLTNTKTPNCNPGPADTVTGIPSNPDSVCRSEDWASIGRVVSDIDIFFISDLDAGAAPLGEGTWQQNPVKYLRFPGGTTEWHYICPVISPVFEATLTAAQECEYHAPRTGQDVESLELFNLGNATLSGVVSVSDFPNAPTLTLSGGTGAYSIPGGNPNIVKNVTMAANGAPEGFYQGAISITHNDATKTSPRVYPIDFFVVDNFFCPEDRILKTGVASPGSLALQVESNGRFASQDDQGGLWRYKDSSATIFDASLLLAHGTQGLDTTVYLRIMNRASNGQFGFRALQDLAIDTTQYGTGSGNATATTYMCSRDSVVGIKMSWYFPQSHSLDEFVVVQYKVFRNRPTLPISDLVIGVLLDEDIVPASRLGTVQTGAYNLPGGDADRKLAYQIGVDTLGHTIVGTKTATRFRGGVAVCGPWQGAYVGNNTEDVQPGGGPTDGFLYNKLTQLSGVSMFTDSVNGIDLYTIVSLDRGRSIASGETLTYVLILASDTIGDASFKATVDSGLAFVAESGICPSGCFCRCEFDPNCDVVVSDVLDVVLTIDRAFRGATPLQDLGCPVERTDVDASGATDVLDVTKVINVAFRGNTAGSQYDLNPCTPGDQ